MGEPGAPLSRRRLGGVVALASLGSLGSGGALASCARPPGPPALAEGLPPHAVRPVSATLDQPALMARPSMAAQALADLCALLGPFPDVPDPAGRHQVSAGAAGAAIAAWSPFWRYVWPRDAAFVVAALTDSGRQTEAAEVLDFLARIAPADGAWQARYLPDGSGGVPDDRGVQSDGAGWVCWAVWAHRTRAHRSGRSWASWWPMVRNSADAMVAALDSRDEPTASSDYWEVRADRVTLETLTAYLVGLRSAAALAHVVGEVSREAAWSAGAARVAGALRDRWAPRGYPRTLPDGGADAAVGLLAALAPDLPGLPAALAAAGRDLRLLNGGVRPGSRWPHEDGVAWTPEVAMLAFGSAGSGAATGWLAWLDAHRTAAGSLPEKVAADGSPSSVAPLGWTCALVLLTLAARRSPAGALFDPPAASA